MCAGVNEPVRDKRAEKKTGTLEGEQMVRGGGLALQAASAYQQKITSEYKVQQILAYIERVS